MRRSIHTTRVAFISATIVLLLFGLLIFRLQAGTSSPNRDVSSQEIGPRSMAVLTIPGNQTISVNSAKAISGATILSGATIATPKQAGARLGIGSLGSLEIAPNSIVKAEFDRDLKVTLTQGCVILRTRKGVTGEVLTSSGVAGKTDPGEGGRLEVCFPQGIWPESEVEKNDVRGLFDSAKAAAVAVIGGRVRSSMAVGLDDRGSNPGPATP